MNANNNEELEKKLSSIQSPQPPEGLLERIKADIPQPLEVAPAPAKRSWVHSWPLRVAATLVVVLGAAIVGREAMKQETLVPAPAREAAPQSAPATPMYDANAPVPEVAFDQQAKEVARGAATSGATSPEPVRNQKLQFEAVQETQVMAQTPAEVPPVAFESKNEADKKVTVTAAAPLALDAAYPASSLPPPPPPPRPAAPVLSQGAGRSDARAKGVEGGIVGGVVGGVVGSAPSAAEALTVERPRSAAPERRSFTRDEAQRTPGSTGGSAEPNAQPYGDVFYRDYGTNPFVDTEDDRFSTFAMDVDTASYTVVRRYLRDGNVPPPEAVRTEELLNYFDYSDAAPRRGDFALYAEGAPSPFVKGERYGVLRFGIRAREVSRIERKPAVLTFVIDVSGSMRREDRLELVKRALGILITELDEGDEIGLVTFGSTARVVMEPTSDHETIRRAVSRLQPEGSTNAEEGLRLGYELAARYARRGAVSRVILCSDGVANVGRTSAEDILREIGWKKDEIELTTVGFGMGNYNDVLMERLADAGNGRYAYVDDIEEARRIFVETLTGTLETVARDAKVQVEFNPKVVTRYRLIGYENRDVADNRFRDDTVDAGEIGAGHHVVAVYEVKFEPNANRREPIAALRVRYKAQGERGAAKETGRWMRFEDFAGSWERASRDLQLASVVAAFGDVLKRSYWSKEIDLRDLADRAARVASGSRDPKAREFADLVERASRLIQRPTIPEPIEE